MEMKTGDKVCGETGVEMETACPQRAVSPGRGVGGRWERGAPPISINRSALVVCCLLLSPLSPSTFISGPRSFTSPVPHTPPAPAFLPSFLSESATSHWRLGSLGSPQQLAPQNTVWLCLRGMSPDFAESVWAGGPASCCFSLNRSGHFPPSFAFPSPSFMPWSGLLPP